MGVPDGFYSQMAAVGLVLLLLAGTLFLLRRRGIVGVSRLIRGDEERSGLRLLGKRGLTSQHAVFTLEAESVRFLVATYPGGVRIQRLDDSFPRAMAESLQRGSGARHD